MKISVIIPVYRRKQMFLDNLSHNVRFLKGCEIVVVDDASGENLRSDIKKKFKSVNVIVNKKNLGFARSVNVGVKASKGDALFLLNSDVRLTDESFLDSSKQLDRDKQIFAISFLQEEANGSMVGKNRIFFKNGFIHHRKADDANFGLNAWAEGGASIVRRKYFEALSGFDPIYTPFYWEDIDLSYRAYKRGWKVLFDPHVRLQHRHESTIGRYFKSSFINRIAYRNQILFFWKNVDDTKLRFIHFLYLPYNVLALLIHRKISLTYGFFEALMLLKKIKKKSRAEKDVGVSTDDQILKLFT